MSLSKYRRKRSFAKTRELEPGKALPPGQRAIFVVQLHHASRRHYDFRLQVGDALKSWAVPNGPSYDPQGQAHGDGGRRPPGRLRQLRGRDSQGFADALAQAEPQRFIATATKRLRTKRIFVDYLRNGRGATAVASYSLRGRPGAPVALPLAWSDLSKLQRVDAFPLRDVPEKLRRPCKDPWAGMDRIQQNLAR